MFVLSLATFLPCVARADTIDFHKVVYSVDDYTSYKFVVVSDNIYNAASLAFGVPPQILSQEVKSKLSDPNYGGRFYDYAHSFEEVDFSGLPSWVNFPDWIPPYVYPTMALAYTSSVYLGGHVYASSVSNFEATLARDDFEAILRGETPDSGDDDENESSDTTTSFILTRNVYRFDDDSFLRWNGFKYTLYGTDNYTWPDDNTITITHSTVNKEVFNDCACVVRPYGNDNKLTVTIVISKPGGLSTSIDTYGTFRLNVKGQYYYKQFNIPTSGVQSIPLSGTYDAGNLNYSTSNETFGAFGCLYALGETGTVPSDPDGDWPDDEPTPSAPSAPQLPEPDDDPYTPDVPDPTDPPTWPEPDFPSGYQPTDLTDILSYLKAINDNLIAIIDDLEDGFSDVIMSFQHLYRILDDIDGDLEDHCSHIRQQMVNNHNNLKTYLYNLFHWLEGELDFQGEGYDDSSVVYWLRRIYNKNSTDTYKPNIINDPDGFFDWLSDVIGNILADLISLLPNAIVDAIDTFTELTHFFPFSIPWDIAAIFALLAHDPVIPVFDIPFPWAAGHVTQIHIDLTQWDPVAQMVRPVMLVYFCFRLALLTRDLMGHLYDFGDK